MSEIRFKERLYSYGMSGLMGLTPFVTELSVLCLPEVPSVFHFCFVSKSVDMSLLAYYH